MATRAKLFMAGRNQAVRLPEDAHFEGDEVIVQRFGTGYLLLPMQYPWQIMREALDEFEPGFALERDAITETPPDGFEPGFVIPRTHVPVRNWKS